MSEYNIQINKYDALNADYDQLYPATKIENVDGLDTALQNNDPKNWGLGSMIATLPKLADAHNVWETGWYYVSTDTTANIPEGGILRAEVFAWAVVRLTLYTNAIASDESITVLHQDLTSNGWEPWEYENPPMVLGQEYRTTERYLGKPVYVKALDFGALPNTTVKHVAIDNQNQARTIRVSGRLDNGTTIPGTNESQTDGSKPIQCYGYGSSVCIYAPYDASARTAVVTAWYTKTTD